MEKTNEDLFFGDTDKIIEMLNHAIDLRLRTYGSKITDHDYRMVVIDGNFAYSVVNDNLEIYVTDGDGFEVKEFHSDVSGRAVGGEKRTIIKDNHWVSARAMNFFESYLLESLNNLCEEIDRIQNEIDSTFEESFLKKLEEKNGRQ